MKELQDLVRGWQSQAPGTPAILATVVGTSGSTYRKAGAKMLITREGWIAGSISGGCLEGDLVQSAWERTENGPALVAFDATAEEDILWGFGLGCNGLVQVFLERLDDTGGPMAYITDRIKLREPGLIATILTPGARFGEHLYSETDIANSQGLTMYVDRIEPPFELNVFGAGHDAVPLVALAKTMGWFVSLYDKRPAVLSPSIFPGVDQFVCCVPEDVRAKVSGARHSAMVLMTHNYLQDRELLRTALESEASYVGLLGPRRRFDRLMQDLRDDGFVASEAQLDRLHAPIGLDIGADGPHEIALAVVAEIQAHLKRRSPTPLRHSTEPLHAVGPRPIESTSTASTQCGLLA